MRAAPALNPTSETGAREEMSRDYLRRILTSRVYEVAQRTPLERADLLSRRFGRDVWIKREDLHPVFSFKIRGAYNKMANLGPEDRARGVLVVYGALSN